MSGGFSSRAGTIAGFDIALSISEEAVNAQLLKLYNTRIEKDEPLPPPTEIERFGPLPPSEHLINHRMSVHFRNEKQSAKQGKPVSRLDGIDGYIQCPRLRFRPPVDTPDQSDALRKYREASVEITFIKDEQGNDSVLKYFDPESPGDLEDLTLTGKTMSWAVNVAQENVGNMLQDLIEGSEAVNPATKKLRNYVDHRVFTVAAIYCLFDKQLVQQSFALVDENRNVIESPAEVEMRKMLALYYTQMQGVVNKTHARIPDFPFSLGYSISQEIAKLEDVSPETAAAMSKNKPYFVPKQFALTVTPGDGLEQRYLTTSGTLNFCMLTHRNSTSDEAVKIDPSDFNAGIIRRNFFDITKTLGKTKDSQGMTQGHDGIMAFSKELVLEKWLPELMEGFYIDPDSAYGKSLSDNLWRPTESPHIYRVRDGDTTHSLKNGYGIYRPWCMDFMRCRKENPYDEGLFIVGQSFADAVLLLGDVTINATVSSELQNISTIQEGLDHARCMYLDLDIKNTMTYAHVTKGLNTLLSKHQYTTDWWNGERKRGISLVDKQLNDKWYNGRTVEVTIKSLVRVAIYSGAAGKWDIDVNEAMSKNLFKADETLNWEYLDPEKYKARNNSTGSDSYGNFCSFERHHSYEAHGSSRIDKEFLDGLKGWSVPTASVMRQSIKKLADGLAFCVVMPAGDVFSFAGLDIDESGQLYAQVDYSNEGGIQLRTG
ncbi:unnamed protein product [Fusarium equiseti]|uniref:Uncharacterized protein n=1 Tax=Fusarium equiseti TaxID=61235 RepID=A0A8J2IQQ6_FUSEQ|nr:unnamed protein product [Fusarium equiseti]